MYKKRFGCILGLCLALTAWSAPFVVTSPDGRNQVSLSADRTLSVTRLGRHVLKTEPLSLVVRAQSAFGPVLGVKTHTLSGLLQTPLYKKAKISLAANVLTADLGRGFALEILARDDGVAWRFVSQSPQRLVIEGEKAGLSFGAGTTLYPGPVKGFAHSYETPYQESVVGDPHTPCPTPDTRWILPLTGHTPSGVWFSVKDTDIRDYPAMSLMPVTEKGFAESFFVCRPVEEKAIPDVRFRKVTVREDYIAETSGVRTFPWRAIALGDTPGDLVCADLFYALAKPAESGDWSWVRPGLCAWDWWNAWQVGKQPFVGAPNTETYLWYIDFAAEAKLPYFLIDGGWAKNLEVDHVRNEVDLPRVMAYAQQRGVGIILWSSWSQLYGRQEAVFRRYAALGVKGFKIDYFNRDDQNVFQFMEETARLATKCHLMIDWHGCPPPCGLQRTYPNIVNWEGVYGLEMAKFRLYPEMPAHDVRLVFTRFLAGPADYTPGGMLCSCDVTRKPDRLRPVICGTRAHQVALYVLFEAPLQMLCDTPLNYRAVPDLLSFLANIPTVWDETRLLSGSPVSGDSVVMARRKASVWFVAAAPGMSAKTITLDTSFLKADASSHLDSSPWHLDVLADGPKAHIQPMDYTCYTQTCRAGEKLTLNLAPGGGWTARFYR